MNHTFLCQSPVEILILGFMGVKVKNQGSFGHIMYISFVSTSRCVFGRYLYKYIYIITEAVANKPKLGQLFKKDAKLVMDALAALDKQGLEELEKTLQEKG